jgi:hypothetical protein
VCSAFTGDLDPVQSAALAVEAVDAGFDTFKIKGGEDWRRDVKRIRAIHQELGEATELRQDPNQAWSFETAVRVGAKLEDAGIYLQYLEQACRIDTFETYEKLRERLRQPICVNEDMYYEHNLTHLLKEDAIDVAVEGHSCWNLPAAIRIARAVEEFDPADPHGSNRYNEIKLRASDKLGFGRNAQAVDDVISEIGVAKTTIGRAEERHQANEALLQGFVEDKENADLYEVSASILSLRNRIEASLTVSSRLSNLSLVRFL